MARFFGIDALNARDPNDLLEIVSLPTLGLQPAVLWGNGHSLAGTRRVLEQIQALDNAKHLPIAVEASIGGIRRQSCSDRTYRPP